MAKAKRSTAEKRAPKAPPSVLNILDQTQELRRGALAMFNATSGDVLEADNLGWVAHKLLKDAERLEANVAALHRAGGGR